MPKTKFKTTQFNSADYLSSTAAINAYMEEALATKDPSFIAHALGTIARASPLKTSVKAYG